MGTRSAREHAHPGKYPAGKKFTFCPSIFSLRGQGDLLLANQQTLRLSEHPGWHLVVLLAYADSLFEDQQHRRALVCSHSHPLT